MLKIGLLYPQKYNKFYVNPSLLQKVKAMVESIMAPHEVECNLFDVNYHSESDIIASEHDLIIVDTPEGSVTPTFFMLIAKLKTTAVLLIGDTISYGESDLFLKECSGQFACNVFGATNEIDIVCFVLKYYRNRYLIDNGTVFRADDFDIGTLKEKHYFEQNYTLQFPDWMLEAYKKNGIQLFMDGLSRGCANNCSFCKQNNLYNPIKKNIYDSRIDIGKTLELLQKACGKQIYIQFTDENFFGGNVDRLRRINQLCERLEKTHFNGVLGIDTRLDTIVRSTESAEISLLRESTWSRLADIGLKYCFIGIETFSDSQAKRYNKVLDLSQFDKAISLLEKHNILYTIGLILLDPLMRKHELQCNLNFIKEKSLLGKTASLLKPLRVQINSQYYYKNRKTICSQSHSSDFFNLDNVLIQYFDPDICRIFPFIKYIYDIFNRSGYRHSDVACFSVLFNSGVPSIIKNIPYIIGKFEYDMLMYLLSLGDSAQTEDVYAVLQKECKNTVDKIIDELRKIEGVCKMNIELESIYKYYLGVFCRIAHFIKQPHGEYVIRYSVC